MEGVRTVLRSEDRIGGGCLGRDGWKLNLTLRILLIQW